MFVIIHKNELSYLSYSLKKRKMQNNVEKFCSFHSMLHAQQVPPPPSTVLGVSWCVTLVVSLSPASALRRLVSHLSHGHAGALPWFLKHACKNRHEDGVWCHVRLWIRSSSDWLQTPVIIITERWKSLPSAGICAWLIGNLNYLKHMYEYECVLEAAGNTEYLNRRKK